MSVRHELTAAVYDAMSDDFSDDPLVVVTFGPDQASELGHYLMVGVDDPFGASADSGTSSEEHGTAHLDCLDVTGSIFLVIFCWHGDSLFEASAAAGKIEDAIRTRIWADVTWGVPELQSSELSDARPSVTVDSAGASLLLVYTLSYTAYLRNPRTHQ